ncbi:MAG: hypothetical protein RL387_1164 [Bacteroidota bacterium]
MSIPNFFKNLILAFCSFLFVLQVSAQDVRDKFSSGTIYDLEKDQLGRIWIASDNGLYVSDGMNFVQIPTGDNAITNSIIRELVLYKDNLYLVYQNKGLIQLNIHSLAFKKITEKAVASLAIEDDAHFMALFQNGDLFKIDISKKQGPIFSLLTQLGNDQDNYPLLFPISKDFLIISLANKGLLKLDRKNGKIVKEYNIVPSGFNNSFSRLGDRIFFINKGQLFELDSNELFFRSKYVKDDKNISFLLPITDKNKIIIKSKKNLFFEKGNDIIQFKLLKTKNYEVNNALFISEDNIIFGSNQGLVKVINQEQKTIPIYDSIVQMNDYVNVRRKIITYSDNQILLLGFPKSHLYNLSTNQFTPIFKGVTSIFDAVLIKNTVFATSEGGGFRKFLIESNKIENIITKDIDTVRYYGAVCDISFKLKDHLILGRRGAFVLYNYKLNTSKEVSLNNFNAKINEIKIDSLSGLIYLATNDGLYSYDIDRKKIIKKTNIYGTIIHDLVILKQQNKTILWYISDKGLTCINLKNNVFEKHLSLSNFDNARLTALLVDKINRLWISSYLGIFAYEFPLDNIIKLDNRIGLVNQEFNYKSAAVLNNGKIVFGGLNGYDIISPEMYNYTNRPLKGTILGYSIYGFNKKTYKHYNPEEVVRYNTSNYYLELYFSMQNFEKFKSLEFEYQIDENGWLPLQGLSYLYMYNLKDGLHTIHIRGWDDSGNPIIFDPVFVKQETNFFDSVNFRYLILFIVILLLLIIGFIYYYNFKELNRIKTNIAMDLHDEIGTILNRTLYTIKDDPILNKQTQLISYLSEALYSIRTYIKAFNTEKVGILQILDEIKEHAANYFKNTGIDYNINYEIDKEVYINSFIYRDLKLIIYEINQNVLKHSKASNVKNKFIVNEGDLIAIIEDNGVLKNIEDIESKGNGITNIRKRVSRLKGDLQFSINPDGSGLIIEIKLNLA